jgi:predicted membrane protein
MGELQVFPEAASTYASKHDALFLVITALTLFFTTIVLVLLTVFAIAIAVDRSRTGRVPRTMIFVSS